MPLALTLQDLLCADLIPLPRSPKVKASVRTKAVHLD